MKVHLIITLLFSSLLANAQKLHLSSLQYEIRWLEESRFPPLVTDKEVQDYLLLYAAGKLAQKFQATDYTTPAQIDYRNITGFGKSKMKTPASSSNPNDYQASVLSFITRATYGFEVLWSMNVEVQQNGRNVYSREINHELLNYADVNEWFTKASFVATFQKLFDELIEISPPMTYKYVLGDGLDWDSVVRARSDPWIVNKNRNILGLGVPDFGPYTTIDADKLDTAVIRTRTKLGTESNIGFNGSRVYFDQYVSNNFTTTKFYYLQFGANTDTMKALFAVITQRLEGRRTVAGQLFGPGNDGSNSQTLGYNRDVSGSILADSTEWHFLIATYDPDGTIGGGFLKLGKEEYQIKYLQHVGVKREYIVKNESGEIFATLYSDISQTTLFIRKDIDPITQKAIATLYAILMSTRNLP